jgi:ribonuclease PH
VRKLREQGALRSVPVSDYVAATSVGVVSGTPMLDLAYDEDSRADVDMNIVKTGDGRFIELQGTAEGPPFERTALDALMELGDRGIRELVALQREILGNIRE